MKEINILQFFDPFAFVLKLIIGPCIKQVIKQINVQINNNFSLLYWALRYLKLLILS